MHCEKMCEGVRRAEAQCTPSRAALMTGRYSSRTGVWHTIMGRSLLRADEITLADVFAASGYRTGIFGKSSSVWISRESRRSRANNSW